jgi:hypothetical protein
MALVFADRKLLDDTQTRAEEDALHEPRDLGTSVTRNRNCMKRKAIPTSAQQLFLDRFKQAIEEKNQVLILSPARKVCTFHCLLRVKLALAYLMFVASERTL